MYTFFWEQKKLVKKRLHVEFLVLRKTQIARPTEDYPAHWFFEDVQFLVSLINFQDEDDADENDENAQTRLFMVYRGEILPSYTRVYNKPGNKDPY